MPATNLALATDPGGTRTEADAAAADFAAVPHTLLRFNNLPYRALVPAAAAHRRRTALVRLHAAEAQRRALAPGLCDALHAAIGDRAGERELRPLLHLKRDVFGGRPTKVALAAVLPHCDVPALHAWYRATAEIAALRGAIEADVAGALDEERALLRAVLAHPDLQRGAMVSSLSIHAAMTAYTSEPVAAHRKGHRKSEYGLLQYALRAMTRTSPYSFYTSVGFGTFDGRGDGAAVALPPERIARVEAHHVVVRRLIDAVIAVPEVREHVRFRPCERSRVEDGQIVYDLAIDDPVAHPRMFRTRQLRGRFPASRPIVAILGWLRGLGPQPYRAITGALCRATGDGDLANTRAVIDKLIAAGLLVPAVPIPENTEDILADAIGFLRALPVPRSHEVADHLGALAELLAALPAAELEARRRIVGALHATWDRAAAAAGHAPGHAPLFYENTALATPVALPAAAWAEARRDLAEVAALVEVFDNNDILQAVFRDVFVARHGVGGACRFEDFLDEVPAVFDRWFRIATMGLPADLRARAPHLTIKRELRRRLRAAVRSGPTDVAEIEVPPALVRDIAAELAASRPCGYAAYGMFVQPALAGDEVARVVLNHAYNGLGQFFSRFLPLLGSAAIERIRRHVRGVFPADRVVAGLRPVVGFNANLHPPLAPDECALGPHDDRDGVVPVDELRLEHDRDADAVVLRRGDGGPRVTVLYAGFLIPFLLPSRYSLLASLEGPGQSHLVLHEIDRSPTDRVSHYPRVRHGRVVLSRRAWFAPAPLFPRPAPGETEAAYFLRLNLWRLEHDLPSRVFIRPVSPVPTGSFDNPADFFNDLDHQREKPQFIDFDSALMTRFLGKWLEDKPDAHVVLEEVSPAPEDALSRSADGVHVTELLIEVDRSPWRQGDPT